MQMEKNHRGEYVQAKHEKFWKYLLNWSVIAKPVKDAEVRIRQEPLGSYAF